MGVRYRCTACGNLTRFDVVERRRTKSFYHFTLGGELSVDQSEDIEHIVESVTCRWCQSSSSIEILDREPVAGDETADHEEPTSGVDGEHAIRNK